ncbi:MAG: hypothetical protein HY927_05885, partial [Elusimicrobia bacterium]|nr:hypothetical protein [Elusimicrobiota bacterium]
MDPPTTDPIRIEPGKPGRIIVRFPYSLSRNAKLRTVEDRWWHSQEKYWTVPHTPATVAQLTILFSGDAVEVVPSLLPGQDPAPQKTTPGQP